MGIAAEIDNSRTSRGSRPHFQPKPQRCADGLMAVLLHQYTLKSDFRLSVNKILTHVRIASAHFPENNINTIQYEND
jgi:hypothetical protein